MNKPGAFARRKPVRSGIKDMVRGDSIEWVPKTKLGRQMLKKLKVYRGPDHEHQAQQPERIELS